MIVKSVKAFTISPDEKQIACIVEDVSLHRDGIPHDPMRIFDATTGRELLSFPADFLHPSDGRWEQLPIEFSPDSRFLAAGRGKHIRVWDATTGKVVRTLTGHLDEVLSLAFSADGTFLVSGSRDCTVKLWDLRSLGLAPP